MHMQCGHGHRSPHPTCISAVALLGCTSVYPCPTSWVSSFLGTAAVLRHWPCSPLKACGRAGGRAGGRSGGGEVVLGSYGPSCRM